MYRSTWLAQEKWSRVNSMSVNQNSVYQFWREMWWSWSCLALLEEGGVNTSLCQYPQSPSSLICAEILVLSELVLHCLMLHAALGNSPSVGIAGEWCWVLMLGAGSSCPWVSGFIGHVHCWHWVSQTLGHQWWHTEPETSSDHLAITHCCRVELAVVAKIF